MGRKQIVRQDGHRMRQYGAMLAWIWKIYEIKIMYITL